MALPWLVAVLLLVPCVVSHKVLLIPVPANSHIVLLSSVGEALVKAGHEAHVLKHHSIPVPSQYKDSGIHYFDHGKKGTVHITQTQEFLKFVSTMSQQNFLKIAGKMTEMVSSICTSFLEDEVLYDALKKEKYDFVVVDGMPNINCFHAIAHRLEVPYATVSVMPPMDMFAHTLQTNFLVTSFPFFYSKEPSFLLRFVQFIFFNVLDVATKVLMDNSATKEYLKDNPVELSELKKRSVIWLIDSEPLFDPPRLSPPNIVFIGGISASKVKPLPADLKKFADSAKEGLIVVSFGGSLVAEFPDEMQRKLLTGLGMLKQKVIIRLKTVPDYKIGPNILITKWLPQNDLLAHPNTVLFVTHCGLSSTVEGIHRGVPLLGFPNQDEQTINAIRFRDLNYGLFMDRNNFTSEELKDTVEKITNDETIKSTMKKAKAIVQGRRDTGAEVAAYWIDHVIKFGGDHLVPYTSKLAWYEVMMYDVLLVILLAIMMILFVSIKCCQCLRRCCCGKGQTKLKTS